MKRKRKNIKINSTVASLFKYLFGFIFLSIDIALTFILRNKPIKWEWIWLPLIGVSFAAMWYLMGSEFIKGNKVLGKLFYTIILIWYLIRGAIVTKYLFGEDMQRFEFYEMFLRAVLNSVGIFFIIPVLFNFTIDVDIIRKCIMCIIKFIFPICITCIDILIGILFIYDIYKLGLDSILDDTWKFLLFALISFVLELINGLFMLRNEESYEEGFGIIVYWFIFALIIIKTVIFAGFFVTNAFQDNGLLGCVFHLFQFDSSLLISIIFFCNSVASFLGFLVFYSNKK